MLSEEQIKLLEVCRWFYENKLVADFCQFIKRPDSFRRLAVGLCGWSWEDEFKQTCIKLGLCWEDAPSKTLPYDGVVNGKKVQCKFECCSDQHEKHSVDIRRRHERRYDVSDFDVMCLKVFSVAQKSSRIFHIPSQVMIDCNTSLKGKIKLKDFLDYESNWHYL